jgi:hypothetical protein
MRKLVLPVALAVGLLLAACLTAPGEPSSTNASALTCASSERAFNGACRTMCTTSAQCAGSNTCMTVAGGLSLCLDYTACAYLGGDTECSGVPFGGYNSYGGYASYDPYWTPTYDPYATSYNGYSSSAEPFGCGGNAVWLSQPPAPTDDPKCGEAHSVVRCKKVGRKCSLVNGTTMDVADR